MKRFMAWVLAAGMTAGMLAGCGGASDTADTKAEAGSEAAEASGATELVFWHNRGGSAGETLQSIVDAYNAGQGADNGIHRAIQ